MQDLLPPAWTAHDLRRCALRMVVAVLFLSAAVLACSQEKPTKAHTENNCYKTSHSDPEYKQCMRAKGWNL